MARYVARYFWGDGEASVYDAEEQRYIGNFDDLDDARLVADALNAKAERTATCQPT